MSFDSLLFLCCYGCHRRRFWLVGLMCFLFETKQALADLRWRTQNTKPFRPAERNDRSTRDENALSLQWQNYMQDRTCWRIFNDGLFICTPSHTNETHSIANIFWAEASVLPTYNTVARKKTPKQWRAHATKQQRAPGKKTAESKCKFERGEGKSDKKAGSNKHYC